ncbi:GNAT family N-acetyltransferase [Limosilactobacillus coleohominis]|uniref:GNAT family N-acetyltransferase n=1 Tax=Limosilactobacillus coleohominis TaxID=181675 RepID=UPI002A91D71A|nr:GNAT family N-acetyltransferase [Limosilactobacillus coleohominis]MDY5629029.1 GNAT family N-acetyltransferase [Limosilactobacillus coleohominis]
MHIEKAQLKDYERIVEILKDGRNQLAERGIDQWQGDYPNPQHVKEDVENGFAYLVHSDDDETVGTFTILPSPDHAYDNLDGEWLMETEDYLTIHRVAIHSDHAGQGYASKLFQEVISYINNNRTDIKSIRIDTHEDNKAMQHLITKSSFTRVGTLHGVYRPEETSYVYEMLTKHSDK